MLVEEVAKRMFFARIEETKMGTVPSQEQLAVSTTVDEKYKAYGLISLG